MKLSTIFLFFSSILAFREACFSQATATLVKDIYPGRESGLVHPIWNNSFQGEAKDGILYFSARDESGQYELWRSDGSKAGTVLHKDLDTRSPASVSRGVAINSSTPWSFQSVDGDIHFQTYPRTEIYKIQGKNSEDVKSLGVIEPSLASVEYKKQNGQLFFYLASRKFRYISGKFLYKVESGSDKILLVNQTHLQVPDQTRYAALKGKWYEFKLSSASHSLHELNQIHPFAFHNEFQGGPRITGQGFHWWDGFFSTTNKLFWIVTDFDTRVPALGGYLPTQQLWTSDGTEAGTKSVKRFMFPEVAGTNDAVFMIGPLDDKLIFTTFRITEQGRVTSIWKSDGTDAGTQLIGSTITESHNVSNIQYYNSNLYFMIGTSLWVTDGTNSGTKLIKNFNTVGRIKIYNNKLYIRDGTKLWISDGTSQGTNEIGVLLNFPVNKFIEYDLDRRNESADFVISGQDVFYGGYTEETGMELWKLHIPCEYSLKIDTPNGLTFCKGSSVQLTAQTLGGNSGEKYTYKWSDGSNGTSIKVEKSGNYMVTASNSKGCSITSSVTVNELSLPIAPKITLKGAAEFCPEDSALYAEFRLEPNHTYVWLRDGNMIPKTQNTGTLLISNAGKYQVEVSNRSGCKNFSDPVEAKLLPRPSVSISPSGMVSTYIPNSVEITASADIPARFQWYKDKKIIAGATSAVYKTNVAGLYNAYAIGIPKGCGAFSASVEVKFDILTSIALEKSDWVQIYPNPATNRVLVKISLEKSSSMTLKIVSASGQVIAEVENKEQLKEHLFDIDLSRQNFGIFLFYLESQHAKAIRKIVKY